jgi:hypothetical protein
MITGLNLRFNLPVSDGATWPALAIRSRSSRVAGTK